MHIEPKSTNTIVIQLLIQNMKHEQLVNGLRKLCMLSTVHDSIISGVVAELMGIPEEDITWEWFDIYMSYLNQASQYEITTDGKNLLPLAETCYINLTKCIEERRTTE